MQLVQHTIGLSFTENLCRKNANSRIIIHSIIFQDRSKIIDTIRCPKCTAMPRETVLL